MTVLIETNEQLQDFLQRCLDRIETLEKRVMVLDAEVNALGEVVLRTPTELDS